MTAISLIQYYCQRPSVNLHCRANSTEIIDKFTRSMPITVKLFSQSLLVAASCSCLALAGVRGEPEKGVLRGEEYLFALSNSLIFVFSLTARVKTLITILFYFTVLDLQLHHVCIAARLYRKLGFHGRRFWKTSRPVS